MKNFLVLLVTACFCLVPAFAFAGNAHTVFYLEIYSSSTNPPLCVHVVRPVVGDIQCYMAKVGMSAYIPLHVGKLDTPPLAQGWPIPSGPGGGYSTVGYSLVQSGEPVSFLSSTACAGFAVGYGTPPNDISFSATSACHDWYDHPGYLRYFNEFENTGATYFDIGIYHPESGIKQVNCQGDYDPDPVVGGRAQWGGTKSIVCANDPTAVDLTTWGKIKGLYR